MSPPIFPERITLPKLITSLDFDILGELRNLCIKIPLLQAIQDIPIYARTIKELCGKNKINKAKATPTVHVVGALSDLLLGKEPPVKYEDPGNPIVTVQISGHSFPNILIDLGATINILTIGAYGKLGISSLEPTTTLLELADRSVIKREGIVQDILVSMDSWEYLANFLAINPKNRMDEHPLILGQPWLATTDAYIGCRAGSMTITRGDSI